MVLPLHSSAYLDRFKVFMFMLLKKLLNLNSVSVVKGCHKPTFSFLVQVGTRPRKLEAQGSLYISARRILDCAA